MKSRRLTIFCVAIVALAGTPRAWQEAGKLLAVVQHKTQVRFWSMVLQPKNSESAGAELVAAAQPFETDPASLDSNCPLEQRESQGHQVWNYSKTARRIESTSSRPQAEAQRPSAVAPLSHAGLIAKALKAPRGDSRAESLRHSRSIMESQPFEVSESRPAVLARHSAPAAPRPPASMGDTYTFVMLPAISPVASALVEKENVVQFKMLKKTFDEHKLIRQKGRLSAIRGVMTFLPST
jgi:hypothetical protein